MAERLTTDPAEVAQARTFRALESTQRAQHLLAAAAEDLCAVQGMRKGWERLLDLYERVKAGWTEVDVLMRQRARTLTLDPLNAASLKRDGGVPAALLPYPEPLDCPGLEGPPCARPVRSRWAIGQELAEAPARAWKYGARPVDEGDTMPQADAALYALEKDTARLAAELGGLCERCASAAAFFLSDVPRPELAPGERAPVPKPEAPGLRVSLAQLSGALVLPLHQVREALLELRKRGGGRG